MKTHKIVPKRTGNPTAERDAPAELRKRADQRAEQMRVAAEKLRAKTLRPKLSSDKLASTS